jgi:hypothetical protein
MSHRTTVQRFWLQATASYPDGPPQRESYLSERAFDRACAAYASEWRDTYRCAGRCASVDCPQCGAQGSAG